MLWAVRLLMIWALALPLCAQQSSPPASSSSSQSSSSKDNAAPSQPQEQTPNADQNTTKPESKVKKDLKDLEPQCVGLSGGAAKCRHSQPNTANTQQEDQERQLRQQCSDSANQGQQQCIELRKSDSARDTKVGDDYLSDKHYPSAVNRYCLALQEDPTNETAKQHLAQALKKGGNKVSGCPESQQQNATESKDTETLKRQ